ncbi:type I restriction enzyme, S subunit [Desulfonatronum thiosulfatophilum]|uniref:Type I restriction enzyme, S subunit n=1 Tax=Desulfonatronum thiosulfatophilum TaxID=617002 RepID=A0A1G6D5A3_9BACT|nr:restriction endonuclease subunit S [Desulfonatronum thiosulfatophilum]SDB40239.1 type I restriction enzyme, S subunit [Desulfonatronum thiosulfatophilum]
MTLETFFDKFNLFADAPGAVGKIRELVLEWAVRGRLVSQDAKDETAKTLLKRVATTAKTRRRGTNLQEEIEGPFQIPKTWEWVRLPHVLTKLTDGTHHSPPNGTSGDFMYVTAKNIKTDGVLLDSITYVTKKVHDEIYSRCDPSFGDILYIKDGATTGIATINQIKEPFSMLSSVALLKPSEAIFNRYLLWAMRSPFFYSETRGAMKGAAITRVTLSVMAASLLPLPPLAEQKRIVAKVDELMALCDQLEAQQQERETRHADLARAAMARFADAPTPANLNFLFHPSYIISPADLRKTILTLAVQGKLVLQDPDDEPAEKFLTLIQNRLAMFKAGRSFRNGIDEKDSVKPFELPPGWAWSRFRELGEFGRGKSKHRPRNDSSLFVGGTHRLVQTGDVARANGAIQTYTALYNDVGLAQSKIWPAGTLCITIAANIADSGILGFDACFPDSVVGFIPAEPIPSVRYFEYFMRTAKEHLEKFAPATAQKNINLGILEQVWIPIPPLAEQRRIVAKVDQLMALVDELEVRLAASRTSAENLLTALVAELTGTTNGRKVSASPAKPDTSVLRPAVQPTPAAPIASTSLPSAPVTPAPPAAPKNARTLAELRKAAGLSQSAVAQAMGLNQAYISQMETGKRAINEAQQRQLAELLGVSSDIIRC